MTERLQITIAGVVQGVGFRPFVHGLATRLGLAGSVTNRAGEVVIEVEGDGTRVVRMVDLLREQPPAASRIDRLETRRIEPIGDLGFAIVASEEAATAAAAIAPDVATCEACLAEIADPAERRHGYAFASCAACGPRLTIVTAAPYDRARTTMAGFPMCDACRAEYADVRDRRFHAQPIACPACGPRLETSIEELAAAIEAGEVIALKGLGGYHLVCDAARGDVVEALRARKHRDAKPFAIMVRDVDEARSVVELDEAAVTLLTSPARPIVLARRRDALPAVLAPGVGDLGVMLPYTPLHHLLLARLARPLVMTSANVTDEPIAYRDDDAHARLGGIADRIVAHDREIHIRCEDSIARIADGAPLILRRARGYAPAPLRLPAALARPTLALGGHFKSSFALGCGDTAFVSPHLGDLDHLSAFEAFEGALAHFQALHRVTPERIVHDLHPDYATTRLAARLGLPRIAIQHHHAHFASGLADAGIEGPAIGVILDGHGFSDDGTIWGGELLAGEAARVARVAHLRAVPQPGGDRAAREPWRMAIAYLREAGEPAAIDELAARHPLAPKVAALCASAVRTSSAGRLFDAVAALVGIETASYEGEAAMRLEALARAQPRDGAYAFERGLGSLDTLGLVRGVVRDRARGVAPPAIARRFHTTLVELVVEACVRSAAGARTCHVVLSGGVFANALLADELPARLREHGLVPHLPRRVPCNDGGLSFGQLAAVAAADHDGRHA